MCIDILERVTHENCRWSHHIFLDPCHLAIMILTPPGAPESEKMFWWGVVHTPLPTSLSWAGPRYQLSPDAPPRLNKAGRVIGGGPRWHSTSCVSSLIPWRQKSTPIQRKCDAWAWCFAYTRQVSAKAVGVRGPPSSAVRQCAWLLMLGYL